jgi:hypothetical protein
MLRGVTRGSEIWLPIAKSLDVFGGASILKREGKPPVVAHFLFMIRLELKPLELRLNNPSARQKLQQHKTEHSPGKHKIVQIELCSLTNCRQHNKGREKLYDLTR